jgi:hypothetical protein
VWFRENQAGWFVFDDSARSDYSPQTRLGLPAALFPRYTSAGIDTKTAAQLQASPTLFRAEHAGAHLKTVTSSRKVVKSS